MTSALDFLMGPAEDESGPFGTGAPVYAPLEYTGIVPVRTKGDKAKTIAMKGVSGRKGVQTLPKHYTGPRALPKYKDHNLGWRLPYGIIGIDVDQYEDKHGAEDLARLRDELGPLPETWSSTARGDGPSRIYFYKVPEDCGELRGSLSESIEIIQHHHRYAMVWPSVHAKTGNTYAWYNGTRSDTPPRLDQIAELPAAWLDYLSKPQREHQSGMGLGVEEFRETYTGDSDPDLEQRIRDRFEARDGCRHDTMLKALGWACRAATYGQVSAGRMFDLLAADWDDATAGEGREREFDTMVRDVVRSTPEPDDSVRDDEYEPDADDQAKDPDGLDIGPDVSKEVRIEALRILRREKALEIVRQFKARKNAGESLSVSDALDEILNGADDDDAPSVAKIQGHEKGWGLFYPGHVNGIYGDGSVGKTVIMAEVQARSLRDGGTVVHWEFDNNPMKSIIRRLVNAGAPVEGIRNRFRVLFAPGDRDALPKDVADAVTLVTLDALNPAVTSFDMDPYHPTGIDTVLQTCLRSFTLNGACGLFLDHVGHENKERQHGAIRKSQAVQGALYEAVMNTELKPGTTGRTRLVMRKDNRGFLGATGRALAIAVMVSGSPGSPGPVSTTFEEPDPFNDLVFSGPMTPEQNVARIIREMDRAGLPAELSQQAARDWLSANEVEIKGRAADWRAAHSARRERSSNGAPSGLE